MLTKQNITLLGVVIAIVLSITGLVGNQPVQTIVQDTTDRLGQTGTRFPDGLYSTFFSIEALGDNPIATSTLGAANTINGLDTYSVSGTMADATTTVFAVQNPFAATSTLTMAILEITGAASTSLNFNVGTSTTPTLNGLGLGCTPGAPTICDGIIIDEAQLATSTAATWTTGEGAVGTIVGLGGGNFLNISSRVGPAGGTSDFSLVVGPTEWVVGYATTTTQRGGSAGVPAFFTCENGGCADGGSDGISNAGNTFAGSYLLQFIKP